MKDFMIAKRESKGLTRRKMATRCECSEGLLALLEEEDKSITHPAIASRIAKEYGLSLDEYNRLVHKKHRADKLPKPQKKPVANFYDAYRNGFRSKDMEEES